MMPGTNHARTIARCGFDWVVVDTEHGNIDGTQTSKDFSCIKHAQLVLKKWASIGVLCMLLNNSFVGLKYTLSSFARAFLSTFSFLSRHSRCIGAFPVQGALAPSARGLQLVLSP